MIEYFLEVCNRLTHGKLEILARAFLWCLVGYGTWSAAAKIFLIMLGIYHPRLYQTVCIVGRQVASCTPWNYIANTRQS